MVDISLCSFPPLGFTFFFEIIYPSLHNFLAKIMMSTFPSIPLVFKPSFLELPEPIFLTTHKLIWVLCDWIPSHVFIVLKLCKSCHSRGCKWGREFGFHWGKKWAWICSHIDDHTASTVEDVTLDCLEYGTGAIKDNEAKEDGYVDAGASRVEGFLMNGSSAGNGRSYGCWASALVMHTLFQKVVMHWKLYRCCWFSKPANWKSGFIRFSHAIQIVYNSLWKPTFSSSKIYIYFYSFPSNNLNCSFP